MCVRFAGRIASAMGVPVMDVMHVRMRMHESLVKMIVLVMFCQV
jgi:Asp/Glu/hydantoin racemase